MTFDLHLTDFHDFSPYLFSLRLGTKRSFIEKKEAEETEICCQI